MPPHVRAAVGAGLAGTVGTAAAVLSNVLLAAGCEGVGPSGPWRTPSPSAVDAVVAVVVMLVATAADIVDVVIAVGLVVVACASVVVVVVVAARIAGFKTSGPMFQCRGRGRKLARTGTASPKISLRHLSRTRMLFYTTEPYFTRAPSTSLLS